MPEKGRGRQWILPVLLFIVARRRLVIKKFMQNNNTSRNATHCYCHYNLNGELNKWTVIATQKMDLALMGYHLKAILIIVKIAAQR
jgi:hypothetical protein